MRVEAFKAAVERARGKKSKTQAKWFWLAAPVLLVGAGAALFSQRGRLKKFKKIVKH